MGAVAASASLAFAGVAHGVASTDGTTTFEATAKPAIPGRRRSRRASRSTSIRRWTGRAPPSSQIVVGLPKGLKFSGKGLKKCSKANLVLNGRTACPAGSKAGPKGTSDRSHRAGQHAARLPRLPVRRRQHDVPVLPGPDGHGRERAGQRHPGRADRPDHQQGRKLTITIPQELRQPGRPRRHADQHQRDLHRQGRQELARHQHGLQGRQGKVTGTLVYSARTDSADPAAVGVAHRPGEVQEVVAPRHA